MADLLDQKATQSGFADMVGVSKQAIQKQAPKIPLKAGQTMRTWLRKYCEHLREEAAGRGGESQARLTAQRIKESEAKTLAMELDNLERLGELVAIDDVGRVFDEFTREVPAQLLGAAEHIADTLESKHSISIDDEHINKPIRLAAERVAGIASKLGDALREGSD